MEALSEALAAMQEATKHIQNAAKATKTEGESLKSGAAKTEKRTKGNWVGKLFAKRKTREYEDGYANLLETTHSGAIVLKIQFFRTLCIL